MKPSRKSTFFSTSSTTVTYTFHNDHSSPPPNSTETAQAQQPHIQTKSATKIQSTYRAHMIRTLYKKISAVSSEADQLQRLIQLQETVDAIRSNDREKLRMNEALMGLLLRLDSVPGVDPTVREARRKVSHRIVALQEILDAISETKMVYDDYDAWRPCDYYDYQYDGFVRNWDDVVAKMEEDICRERGGDEMERYCAEHLGFRCLQRFLRGP
uniref:BAG domain-containing protein n=1 Tax=Fagus sylvatica TaxID=28930 RepID=A0A2N9IWA5_FAGSY